MKRMKARKSRSLLVGSLIPHVKDVKLAMCTCTCYIYAYMPYGRDTSECTTQATAQVITCTSRRGQQAVTTHTRKESQVNQDGKEGRNSKEVSEEDQLEASYFVASLYDVGRWLQRLLRI